MEPNYQILDLPATSIDRCTPYFKNLPVYKQEQELKILFLITGGSVAVEKLEYESEDDYRTRCFHIMFTQLDNDDYYSAFVDTYINFTDDAARIQLRVLGIKRRIHRRKTFLLEEYRGSKFNTKIQNNPRNNMWSAPDKNHFVSKFRSLPVDKQEDEIKNLSALVGVSVTNYINKLQSESDEDYKARRFEEMFDQLPVCSLYPEAFRDTYEPEIGRGKIFDRLATYFIHSAIGSVK